MGIEPSIFKSIKALLGPESDYEAFDHDILLFINGVLSTLTQLGIGPKEGFRITGDTETWDDLLGDNHDLDFVKDYIFMKVKLIFDPPASSAVMSAYQEHCKELEWRINVAVDPSRLDL